MSTSSIKPVPTLKGVFSMPKMNHRRDFLRENKLNLRELQRVTTKKQASQQELQHKQQALQQKQKCQQQHHHQQQQQQKLQNTNRRSASQQRVVEQRPRNNAPRSISQQRSNSQLQLNLGCSSCNGAQGGSSSTAISVTSKAESYDKEIQTDDINDQEFLYDALKKCSTSEFNCASSIRSHIIPARQSNQSKHDLSGLHLKNHEISGENYKSDFYELQDTGSEDSPHYNNNRQLSAKEKHNPYSDNSQNYHLNDNNHLMEAINLNVGNLAIGKQVEQQEDTPPLSGGSRHTINSTHQQDAFSLKKKDSSSLHKFGSRDDIRLPRYLEREKREKEEQRIREMVRDPNCPFGHFALTDEERYSALAAAEKKFKSLVNELNRMPMTTETLRIRTRKAEIEKELVVLETDIRIFSKPKVYVKHQQND